MSKKKPKANAETPIASKAEDATGQNGPAQRPLWTVGERIGHGGTRFIRISTTVTGKRGIQLDWPIAAVYREDKANADSPPPSKTQKRKPNSSVTTPDNKHVKAECICGEGFGMNLSCPIHSGEKEPASDSHQTGQKARYTPGPLSAEGRRERFLIATVEDHDEAEADATLFAVAPELLDACKFFIGAIEDGDLVRDITKDNDPNWAMKMMKFASDLGKAASAISRAERRAS